MSADTSPSPDRSPTRRGVVLAAVGLAGVAVGATGWANLPSGVRSRLGLVPDAWIPDAPEGRVVLETVASQARGRDVGLFTAVPEGFGDGAGLPVVVTLHGASATTADFAGFGFGRFLTAAVRNGAAPFVLAGADGGRQRWEPDAAGDDDPQAMVRDELPTWLDERGFDAGRRALWGWSMGGYGVLRLAEVAPDDVRAVAAFSPALASGDAAYDDLAALADVPLAVWCGVDDPLLPRVEELVERVVTPPVIASFGSGAHTRAFWNDQTLEAFGFLSAHL